MCWSIRRRKQVHLSTVYAVYSCAVHNIPTSPATFSIEPAKYALKNKKNLSIKYTVLYTRCISHKIDFCTITASSSSTDKEMDNHCLLENMLLRIMFVLLQYILAFTLNYIIDIIQSMYNQHITALKLKIPRILAYIN